MVHRFVPRCQFGCGCGWFGHGSVPCVGVVCWVVASGWRIHSVPAMGSAPVGAPLWSPRGLNLIQVCARWCPTLPHPGGCSTIGAVRLSFRVRDGCRAFPCRCDHRDDYVGSALWTSSPLGLYSVVRVTAPSQPTLPLARGVCGWWCGLGVDRIVDALRMLTVLTPQPTHAVCVVCWGVVVCVGLLVPVSSQTVAGLPLLAYQPSSLLGAYQKGQVLLVETLS